MRNVLPALTGFDTVPRSLTNSIVFIILRKQLLYPLEFFANQHGAVSAMQGYGGNFNDQKLPSMKSFFFIWAVMIFLQLPVTAQVYSDKIVGEKHQSTADSIKKSEWPYMLPIWGKKVTALGFKLPYPAGMNLNYLWQRSDLVIEDLLIGFNGGPKYDLDEIVRFDKAQSEAKALNFRPDIWVLPFLNVYAIFAKGQPSTAVGFGIWVPDSTNTWSKVFSYETTANFSSTTFGFGITPTIGVGGGWFALDMNVSWSDVDALDKPAFAFVLGPRLGKSFNLKGEQSVAVWVGGFRLKLASSTAGNLALNDLVDDKGSLQGKIDAGQQKVTEKQQSVDAWWNGLSDAQKQNPVNEAKYTTANRALSAAGNVFNSLESGLSTVSNSTVQYSLSKRVKDPWNFTVGGQYQLSRRWMLRGEFGFLGSRSQFIGGLQYRFGF
jgi:hypothetical protein